MATVKYGLQASRSRLQNIARRCNITHEKVAAFGLAEWFDDMFVEVL